MVKVFQEEYFLPFLLFDARCVVSVRLIARRDDQVVILDGEAASLEQISTVNQLFVPIQANGFPMGKVDILNVRNMQEQCLYCNREWASPITRRDQGSTLYRDDTHA